MVIHDDSCGWKNVINHPWLGMFFPLTNMMMTGDALWSLWTCFTLIHRCVSHKNVVVLVAEVHLHDCFHATGLRHAGSGMRETRASHDSAGALATQENWPISWTQMMVSWGDGEIHGDFFRGKDVYDQLTSCGHWNHVASSNSSSNQSWLENGKAPQFDDFPNKHPSIGDVFFGIFSWCSHGVFPIAPGKESAWHHGLQFILLIGLWDFPVPRWRSTGSAWDGLGGKLGLGTWCQARDVVFLGVIGGLYSFVVFCWT